MCLIVILMIELGHVYTGSPCLSLWVFTRTCYMLASELANFFFFVSGQWREHSVGAFLRRLRPRSHGNWASGNTTAPRQTVPRRAKPKRASVNIKISNRRNIYLSIFKFMYKWNTYTWSICMAHNNEAKVSVMIHWWCRDFHEWAPNSKEAGFWGGWNNGRKVALLPPNLKLPPAAPLPLPSLHLSTLHQL